MPIIAENLSHSYSRGTRMEVVALNRINIEISDGEKIGIIGRTGSGKTTLVQHFNGLLKATGGRVVVDGTDITAHRASARGIRRKIGLVFQYPEHQLFEETVGQDIAFGPRNLGVTEPELSKRVGEAMDLVGLPAEVRSRSPFELSGGQMRRVAIAGVLAMKPGVLILDEPTAGLDPRGREELLDHLDRLHQNLGITIILVSHTMMDIARLVDRVIVMDNGEIALEGSTRDVFVQVQKLERAGLAPPPMTRLMHQLKARGKPVRTDILTVDEAVAEIVRMVKGA